MSEESVTKTEPSRASSVVFVLICLTLVLSVLAYGAVESWAYGFLTLITGLIGVFWLADGFTTRELRVPTHPLLIPLGGLVLLGLVQLLPFGAEIGSNVVSGSASALSINPYATRLAITQLVLFIIFLGAVLTFVDSGERLRRVTVLVIAFGSAMAFFGILQALANPEGIYGLRPTPQARPFASFVNRHHFATFMQMTIALALALLLGEGTKKDKRLLLIIALVLMGIGLILTGSRGGFLSIGAVVTFVVAATYLRRHENDNLAETGHERRVGFRRKVAIAVAVLGIAGVIGGSVLFLGGDDAFRRGLGFTGQEDISSGRLHFWGVAVEVFKDHPVIGSGLDTFGTAFPQYDTWNGNLRVEQVHNDYLQMLADGGVVGLALVLLFIFVLYRSGLRRISNEHSHFARSLAIGGLGGCLGVIVHSFFDFPLRTTSNTFYFLLLAAFAVSQVQLHKRRSHHS